MFLPPPGYRRWFALSIAAAIFIAWDGFTLLKAVVLIATNSPLNNLEISFPFGISTELSKDQVPIAILLVVKTLVSVGLALWLERMSQSRIIGEIRQQKNDEEARISREQAAQLLNLLIAKAGIDFTSVQGLSGKNAVDQKYAEVMRKAVGSSKHVRIISIAACQAIGMREKSLLYELLRSNRIAPLSIILLDPQSGTNVIEDRARSLGNGIHPESIRSEIYSTIEAVGDLRDLRAPHEGRVTLRYSNIVPAFRMLLTDDHAFVSAYQPGKQGHETPVLVFKKADPREGPEESFYEAFSSYFTAAWTQSTEKTIHPAPQASK